MDVWYPFDVIERLSETTTLCIFNDYGGICIVLRNRDYVTSIIVSHKAIYNFHISWKLNRLNFLPHDIWKSLQWADTALEEVFIHAIHDYLNPKAVLIPTDNGQKQLTVIEAFKHRRENRKGGEAK